MKEKLKFGLILSQHLTLQKICNLIELSSLSDNYEIYIFSINKPKNYNKIFFKKLFKYGFLKFISEIFFSIIILVEKFFLNKTKKIFRKKLNLNKINSKIINLNPLLSQSGEIYDFNNDDIKKIKSLKLDLFLKSGCEVLENKISESINIGFLSMIFENYNQNLINMICFSQVLSKKKNTEFQINLLRKNSLEEKVLIKGNIKNLFFLTLNFENLMKKSISYLDIILNRIANNNFESINENYINKLFLEKNHLYPSFISQINYLFLVFYYFLKKLIRKIFSQNLRWGVAYQFTNNWKDAELSRSVIIKNPPNRFFADPFIWQENNIHYCFVEDFSYKENKGCISVLEVSGGSHKYLGVALIEDFHLSYPFIFKDNGNLYMCPETHEANDIRIYRCENFPLKWKLEKILIRNISAVDTNIFFKENKWWLMTNSCSAKNNDFSNELHIFYSDHLLNHNWKPHSNNPVIIDSLKGRNAGLIIDGKNIFRITQQQGFDVYGEQMGVSKICELTNLKYKEDDQFKIKPSFFENIKGTHTYNFNKGLLVVDFVKFDGKS